MPAEIKQYKDQLDGRAMLVKKAKVVQLEAIVRGYITGKYGTFEAFLVIHLTHI